MIDSSAVVLVSEGEDWRANGAAWLSFLGLAALVVWAEVQSRRGRRRK